jgi:hypothetical protein
MGTRRTTVRLPRLITTSSPRRARSMRRREVGFRLVHGNRFHDQGRLARFPRADKQRKRPLVATERADLRRSPLLALEESDLFLLQFARTGSYDVSVCRTQAACPPIGFPRTLEASRQERRSRRSENVR